MQAQLNAKFEYAHADAHAHEYGECEYPRTYDDAHCGVAFA